MLRERRLELGDRCVELGNQRQSQRDDQSMGLSDQLRWLGLIDPPNRLDLRCLQLDVAQVASKRSAEAIFERESSPPILGVGAIVKTARCPCWPDGRRRPSAPAGSARETTNTVH